MVPGCKQAVGNYIRIQACILARIQLIPPPHGLKQARGLLAVYNKEIVKIIISIDWQSW